MRLKVQYRDCERPPSKSLNLRQRLYQFVVNFLKKIIELLFWKYCAEELLEEGLVADQVYELKFRTTHEEQAMYESRFHTLH